MTLEYILNRQHRQTYQMSMEGCRGTQIHPNDLRNYELHYKDPFQECTSTYQDRQTGQVYRWKNAVAALHQFWTGGSQRWPQESVSSVSKYAFFLCGVALSEGLLFGAISANPVVSLVLLEMLLETSSPPRLSVATPLSWTPLRRRIRTKESWNLTKYAIITKVLHNQKPGWKWNVVCLMKVYRKKRQSLWLWAFDSQSKKTKSRLGVLPFEFDWIGQRQVLDWEACKAKENRQNKQKGCTP